MHTLLITGFGPWGEYAENASRQVIARALPQAPPGWRLQPLELPVSWSRAFPLLHDAIDEHVRGVLCLGQAEDDAIRLEEVARNRADPEARDAEGALSGAASLAADGPATLRSRLPLGRLEKALARAEVPARRTDDAGAFLCNALFYALMQHVEHRRGDLVAGFVHVPAAGRMSPATLDRALGVLVAELIDHAEIRTRATAPLFGA